MKKSFAFTLLFAISVISVFAVNVPAFPGAEGWGRYTTGGRGGTVYYITSLDDNPDNPAAGTLRYAINQSGARTILFSVSGTIHLKSRLNIQNGDLTIAGQSAPGDGICIANFPVSISANNVIMRFIRVRMGDELITDADGADALDGRGLKRVIVDHCSCSWSTDECVSFYGDEDFTLQWCIISESLKVSKHTKGSHGYGGIWGGHHASFHHNFLVHHSSRTPRLGAFYGACDGQEDNDLRNNVLYNHGGNGCYGAEGMRGNIVNCYYKPGPASQTGERRGQIIAIGFNSGDPLRPRWGQWYVSGNVINSANSGVPTNYYEKRTTNDNWTYGVLPFINRDSITATELTNLKATAPFDPGEVTTHTAEEAYKKVLAYSGCSLLRDTIDKRLVNEAKTGTTTFTESRSTTPLPGFIDTPEDLRPANADSTWTPWPVLTSTAPPKDTDQDGIPDNWEDAHGLRKTYRLDGRNIDPQTGYSYLEEYLNSLVEDIMEAENKDSLFTTAINVPVADKNDKVQITIGDGVTVYCENGIKNIQMYNLSGLLLCNISPKENFYTIEKQFEPKGVYLLKVTTNSYHTQISKVIL